MRHTFSSILFCCLGAASTAAPGCDASAPHGAGYERSIQSVQRLPELAAWSRSHSFPVVYGQSIDRQVLVRGRCYWSVSVYADRPERSELWHVFYVQVSGKPLLVQDAVSGDAISLKAWRAGRKQAGLT
jgi:hypothetical protein